MSRVEFIRCFYEPKLCQGLSEHEILGWESSESQRLRFEALAGQANLQGKKLLDVGCGLGSLNGFLRDRGITCRYTGVDILETMVLEAAKRYPYGRYLQGDVFTTDIFPDKSFDVVFSSGIFNLNLGNNSEFFQSAVKKLIALARETVSFNLLHKHSPNRDDQNYYYFHPEEVTKILIPLLPEESCIRIVDKYLPNDFTVICSLQPD